ncbi:tetratricopeptide repeat protein [bacterium]|nr:tetratricopeptide repeat protein [bacterium]
MPQDKITPLQIDRAWANLDEEKPEAVLEALQEDHYETTAAHTLRAIALEEQGRHEEAVAEFDAILKRQPENAVARLNRGLALHGLGRNADAAKDFSAGPIFPSPGFLKRFLRRFWPLHFENRELLARGFDDVQQDWPHKAKVQAFRESPESFSPAARRRLARDLERHGMNIYHRGAHATACRIYEAAWELDPEDEIIRAGYSWCLLGFGFHEQSRELIEPLVRDGAERYRTERRTTALPHPQIVVQWAWCLHEAGEHREALAVLSTVRPEGPDDFGSHIVAALSWDALGDPLNADRAYVPALQDYFLDTWEQFIQPFIKKTVSWLAEESAPE